MRQHHRHPAFDQDAGRILRFTVASHVETVSTCLANVLATAMLPILLDDLARTRRGRRCDHHGKGAYKALVGMGFGKQEVRSALSQLEQREATDELEPLVRAALGLLVS